jgi:hypothetical protein
MSARHGIAAARVAKIAQVIHFWNIVGIVVAQLLDTDELH